MKLLGFLPRRAARRGCPEGFRLRRPQIARCAPASNFRPKPVTLRPGPPCAPASARPPGAPSPEGQDAATFQGALVLSETRASARGECLEWGWASGLGAPGAPEGGVGLGSVGVSERGERRGRPAFERGCSQRGRRGCSGLSTTRVSSWRRGLVAPPFRLRWELALGDLSNCWSALALGRGMLSALGLRWGEPLRALGTCVGACVGRRSVGVGVGAATKVPWLRLPP